MLAIHAQGCKSPRRIPPQAVASSDILYKSLTSQHATLFKTPPQNFDKEVDR